MTLPILSFSIIQVAALDLPAHLRGWMWEYALLHQQLLLHVLEKKKCVMTLLMECCEAVALDKHVYHRGQVLEYALGPWLENKNKIPYMENF